MVEECEFQGQERREGTEMVASVLIMAVSIALLLYWFRYSCVLILSTRTTRDYSASVALANQLSFPEFRTVWRGPGRRISTRSRNPCLRPDSE